VITVSHGTFHRLTDLPSELGFTNPLPRLCLAEADLDVAENALPHPGVDGFPVQPKTIGDVRRREQAIVRIVVGWYQIVHGRLLGELGRGGLGEVRMLRHQRERVLDEGQRLVMMAFHVAL